MDRTNPDTSVQLPDEDRVAFPESWSEYTLDRRDRPTPRQISVDSDAPARLQALFAEAGDELEQPLGLLQNPDHLSLIRAGLAGEPDPLAAGLALALLARVSSNPPGLIFATGTDAWIARHGVVFAARALVETQGHVVYWYEGGKHREHGARVNPAGIHSIGRMPDFVSRLAPVRSLLAALSESEHAEAVAAIEAHRTTDAKKFLSAMLIPDQEAWVLEACRIHRGRHRPEFGGDMLWSIVSKREHLELSEVRSLEPRQGAQGIARLIDALGVEAMPILVNTLEREDKPPAEVRDLVFDAIGRLPSDAAMVYLLQDLTNPNAMKAAKAAAERFPRRALRAIAEAAPNAIGSTRARLAGLAKSNPLLIEAASSLDEAPRVVIEQLHRSSTRHPVAGGSAVPDCFTTPPWSEFVGTSARAAVQGLVPPSIEELRWAEGEQEEWRKPPAWESYFGSAYFWARTVPGGTDHAKHSSKYWFPNYLAYAPDVLVGSAIDEWDGGAADSASARTLKAILARYGTIAVARVQAHIGGAESHRAILMPLANLEAARTMADSLTRSPSHRLLAKSWFDRHPEAGAALLIPDALGKDSKAQLKAAKALCHLADFHRQELDDQAAAYGEAASAAVTALVDADPLDPRVERIPKPGAWADLGSLPQVLLAGGEEALPAEAVRTLMSALAMDDLDRPYRGVDLLAAECDPASLASFSWGLFELWLASGAPSSSAWAMNQLSRFADDGTVRRLSELIRQWPGQNQSRKAVRGVEILGAIGTETALSEVHNLSRTVKFKALKKTAAAQIDSIADRLGLSTDELADRIVPEFGLREESALTLDYGSRTFTVRFDEQLRPYVVDQNGKRRAGPPKPATGDDPELAGPAHERFAALRREIKKTAAEQVKRLEQALVKGRTWTVADFNRYLVDHPLNWQLTSRLVWQAVTEGRWTSFRLAEDRTLADLDDEPMELPDGAAIRLAHPVTLGEEVEPWAEVLVDYEILQPFAQLQRPALAITDQERESGRLSRFEGAMVGGGPLIGLLSRGWSYGDPRPDRGRYGLYFEFREGGYVLLDPEPGVYPGPDPDGDQKLALVELVLPEGGRTIDPVQASEVLHTIAKLTRSA